MAREKALLEALMGRCALFTGEVVLVQELSSCDIDCGRISSEKIILGCAAPYFEAPSACHVHHAVPRYIAAILHRATPSWTRLHRAFPLRATIRTRR